MEEIKQFLVKAKQNTYANSTGQTVSSRPHSYDLEYSEEEFTYLDSYVGTHSFSGQEIIWKNQEPIWSMNYYGNVLHSSFKSSFLKAALMHPTTALPYRGKEFYREEEYTYLMEVTGNFDKFSGSEKIFFNDVLTYELFFHGGKIIDKHFD
jgi:hypothetical protein